MSRGEELIRKVYEKVGTVHFGFESAFDLLKIYVSELEADQQELIELQNGESM